MKYVVKKLKNSLNVTGIVNLHFFEFGKNFTTVGERHPFYELIFVNSGMMFISSDDYTGYLKKGQLIIHKPDENHSLRCDADNEPTVIIIGFVCQNDLLNDFSKSPLTLDGSAVKKLAEIVKEGRNVFAPPYNRPTYNMKKQKNQPFGSEQLLKIMLEYFLITLVSGREQSELPQKLEDGSAAIAEVIRYVDCNYLEKITISELAFLFRTNRSTLCKDFKKATGTTLIDYVNGKKLEAIKEKIEKSDESFTVIAEEMKFESIHYFTRFFKKMTGMTPSSFRAQFRA